MDVVLLIIAFYYAGQTLDVLARKLLDKGNRPTWLLILPASLFPAYLLGPSFFNFALLFLVIFWSSACRSSDYGLSYHFTLVVAGGLVYGPAGGAVLGVVPLILIPYFRPDVQVISIALSAIMIGASGLLAGFLTGYEQGVLFLILIGFLVLYNIIRALILFGKLPPKNTLLFAGVNIAVNYYLITRYLVKIVNYLGASI